METQHFTLFAFPVEHIDEIAALYDAWRHALDELHEDSDLHANRLYDRAAAVAAYQASLVGPERQDAHAELAQLFYMRLWKRRKRKVFSPQECAHYRAKLTALIQRLGGEDGLVRRLTRNGAEPDFTADHVRDVYRAVVQALDVAVDRGLAFTWAHRDDDAEARLERERREREATRRADEDRRRNRPPGSLEDAAAELRALREAGDLYLLEEAERVRQASGRAAREPWEPGHGVDLLLIDDDTAAAAHDLLLRAVQVDAAADAADAGEAPNTYVETSRLTAAARDLVADRALARTVLARAGERTAMVALAFILVGTAFDVALIIGVTPAEYLAAHRASPDTTAPPPSSEVAVYDSRQVSRLLSTLREWEATDGHDAVIDEIVKWSAYQVRPLCASAVEACAATLAEAERRGVGMAWMAVRR